MDSLKNFFVNSLLGLVHKSFFSFVFVDIKSIKQTGINLSLLKTTKVEEIMASFNLNSSQMSLLM
jgi:hypothetical protein